MTPYSRMTRSIHEFSRWGYNIIGQIYFNINPIKNPQLMVCKFNFLDRWRKKGKVINFVVFNWPCENLFPFKIHILLIFLNLVFFYSNFSIWTKFKLVLCHCHISSNPISIEKTLKRVTVAPCLHSSKWSIYIPNLSF